LDDARFDARIKTIGRVNSCRGLTRLLGRLSVSGGLVAVSVRDAAAALLNGGPSRRRVSHYAEHRSR